MEFNNQEESAFKVLADALEEAYADQDGITGIYYDPIWVDVLKEVRVATDRLKGHNAIEVANWILNHFWLAITIIDGTVQVSRKKEVLQPTLPL